MPNRYLRDSIRTSRSLSMISWLAEVLFLHLLVAVDDYGRYMAEIPILRGQLFSLRTGLSDEMLSDALSELEKEGVIRRYHANGREYLQIMNWYLYQKPRAKNSKFPDPPFAVPQRCEQMHADVAITITRATTTTATTTDLTLEMQNSPCLQFCGRGPCDG